MLKDKYSEILIFDLETTGLDPFRSNIIEIGAILLKKTPEGAYGVSKELNVLIKQSEPLPEKIIEITGITDDLLNSEGISEAEAFKLFTDIYSSEALLVAYNLSFDYSFINELFRRHLNERTLFINNDVLDVMAIYKDRHPFPHRLESAVSMYNVINESAHRAKDDAMATLKVLVKMIEERDTTLKYINVIGYNPKYGPNKYKSPYVSYVPQYGNRLEIERR